MTATARPFSGAADLRALLELTSALEARRAGLTLLHPGDIVWQGYQNTVFDREANIHLWWDGGTLSGFAWFTPPNAVAIDLAPGTPIDSPLAEEMLAWAGQRALDCASGDGRVYLATNTLTSDAERVAFLERLGYRESPVGGGPRFRLDLRGDLPTVELPPGFSIRPVADEADFEDRVNLHRDAWRQWAGSRPDGTPGESSVTLDAYRILRQQPFYNPELDIVAVAPDGRFASYLIAWADPATGFGTIEPVGTRPEFQRLGLSRAVNREALRRLRGQGMHTALVATARINEPAKGLYPSAGFEHVTDERYYAKRLR